MIEPEIWFALYKLAMKGAIHESVIVKTSELGDDLGVSQQTASRRIATSLEEGYVVRVHTASGMSIRLTEKGRNQLARVFSNLEIAFAPPKDEIRIEGTVVGGLGEGAYYVDMYSDRFEESLGFKPYLGTLNVKVSGETAQQAVSRMKHSPPLVVQGFREEGRTFGDVICYRVLVNGKIEAAIVLAQRTHHGKDILEVIAPMNIRKKLNLKDGDKVELALVPLHLAT
ncbi:CTP-dependent riboflavin kinase [Candidatus Thorarchaeota archaeon]|nr:MAG: CTP-dependent riboflavin kinase [Candidatus Thorarchaeota archaeon]